MNTQITKPVINVPRYFINTSELGYYWMFQQSDLTYVRNDINSKNAVIYLDILDNSELPAKDALVWKKVKLYLDDGVAVTGYIPCSVINYIHISNMNELLDGRFNS